MKEYDNNLIPELDMNPQQVQALEKQIYTLKLETNHIPDFCEWCDGSIRIFDGSGKPLDKPTCLLHGINIRKPR